MTTASIASPPSNGYPYQRLMGEDDIRVLNLLPGRYKDALHGQLKTVSRGSTKYEALSYVWGPTTKGCSICLDCKYAVALTDNLSLALRRLRYRSKVRTIWIDAICIDQSDNEEKSMQVAVMAKIYAAAEVVDVWLGEIARARSYHLSLLIQPSRRSFRPRARKGLLWATCQLQRAVASTPLIDVDAWHTRAWTFQEMAIARAVRLHLGGANVTLHDEFPAHGCHHVLPLLSTRLGRPEVELEALLIRLEHKHWFAPQYGDKDLRRSLQMLRGTSAMDPRDMVYSFVGLLDSHTQGLLQPNYNLTYAQVCAHATAVSLQKDLSILAYVDLGIRSDQSIASWTVDFARDEPFFADVLGRFLNGRQLSYTWESNSTVIQIHGRNQGGVAPGSLCQVLRHSDFQYGSFDVSKELLDHYALLGHPRVPLEELLRCCTKVSGGAQRCRLQTGKTCLGPMTVEAGDQLVRLCLLEPFPPDLFMWLRPCADLFTFQGFGYMLDDAVYAVNTSMTTLGPVDERDLIGITGPVETFVLR